MPTPPLNLPRCRRLAERAIRALDLDLTGLVVLTEAATGAYALTAPLAALAGADRVIALTRDSRFGTAVEASGQTIAAASAFGVKDRIEITRDRASAAVADADIVTNLGFVRPLDRAMLRRLKVGAVVPLMFETWEFRHEDVDLAACHEFDIAILGTNESVPALRILEYLAPVAIRLLFECDIEVQGSDLVVLGSGPFVDAIIRGLAPLAGSVRQVEVEDLKADMAGVEKFLADADAVIVAEHRLKDRLIGAGGYLGAADLKRINPGLALVHIAGSVEREDLARSGVIHAPNSDFAPPGFMTVTTAFVGPRPLLDLHAGGLKVGELLARARLSGASREDAERMALAASPICQAFGSPIVARA